MHYLRLISERDQNWADAARATVSVVPKTMTSTDWDIVDLARSGDFIKLNEALPMEMGEIRESFRSELCQWAQQQTRTFKNDCRDSPEFVDRAAFQYGKDLHLLHEVAYGKCRHFTYDCEIGFFVKPRIGVFHTDDSSDVCLTYLTRVNALPFHAIPGHMVLTEAQKKLLDLAEQKLPRCQEARYPEAVEALKEQHVAPEAGIDKVHALLMRPTHLPFIGTKHVSGLVPAVGAASGLLRATARLN